MAGWRGWWRRWFGRRKRQRDGRRGIPAPATLVARIESASDLDRDIVRLADESLRRGFPDQAEVAYAKAAAYYQSVGHHRKEVAVLRALARLRPDDPEPLVGLADALERLERRADAARTLRDAAARHRAFDEDSAAAAREARAAELDRRALDEEVSARAGRSASMPTGERPAVDADGPAPLDVDLGVEPEDLPDEEVNSLVLEALSRDAIDVDAPGPIVLPGLDTEEVPRAHDDPDPFEEPTPVEPAPRAKPAAPPPAPRIPDDPTTVDPSGSAAMRADERAGDEETNARTRVAPDAHVARLLERLRNREK